MAVVFFSGERLMCILLSGFIDVLWRRFYLSADRELSELPKSHSFFFVSLMLEAMATRIKGSKFLVSESIRLCGMWDWFKIKDFLLCLKSRKLKVVTARLVQRIAFRGMWMYRISWNEDRVTDCGETFTVFAHAYLEFFAREWKGRGMELTTYLHLVHTLKMPPLPHTLSWRGILSVIWKALTGYSLQYWRVAFALNFHAGTVVAITTSDQCVLIKLLVLLGNWGLYRRCEFRWRSSGLLRRVVFSLPAEVSEELPTFWALETKIYIEALFCIQQTVGPSLPKEPKCAKYFRCVCLTLVRTRARRKDSHEIWCCGAVLKLAEPLKILL
jgi:hypothetical protein